MKASTALNKAAELCERFGFGPSSLVSVSVYGYDRDIVVHLKPKALVQVFHELNVKRTALKIAYNDGFVHVDFRSGIFNFGTCFRQDEAQQFVELQQQHLPEPGKAIRRITHG